MIDFEKYDNENPQVWEGFKKYAFEAKKKGFKNYSANGIFEILRWHTPITGNDQYKISNNYKPDYARKMMDIYPDFEGFFRTKNLWVARKSKLPENIVVDDNGQTSFY
jgi:hypothetical protein